MKPSLLLVLLFLINSSISAQKTAEDYLGTWLMYAGNTKVTNKFSLHTLAHFRVYEPAQNFQHFLFRFGVNYSLSKKSNFGVGYDYLRAASFEKDANQINKNDHRFFEQFIIKSSLNRVNFNHRYRMEHRWIKTIGGERDFSNRLRYRLLLTVPLTKPKMEPKTLFLNVYDEVHLLFQENAFQQNWFYVALGYKLNRLLSFQAGYQTIHTGTKQYDRLMLGVFMNIDLTNVE